VGNFVLFFIEANTVIDDALSAEKQKFSQASMRAEIVIVEAIFFSATRRAHRVCLSAE
jgi:hypothetical protein